MKKSKGKSSFLLRLDTKVDLVAIKGENVFIKTLTYEEALHSKRAKGWTYIIYQLGFAQYKNAIRK